MSVSTPTRSRQTSPGRHQVIDLTRDSSDSIHRIMTPLRQRPVPQSHSTTSSTSTNDSSTEIVFDEDVQHTPMTPGTPVEDLGLSRDPFTEATSSIFLARPFRSPSRGITPTKKQASSKSTTREAEYRAVRSRQLHSRSVSSTTKLSQSKSIIDDSNQSSPCPSATSARRRASLGTTTPVNNRTSCERRRAPDSNVSYPAIPGHSESTSGHLELQNVVRATKASPTTKHLTEPHHISDQPCSQQGDPDDGFQQPKFDKYKLKNEKHPLSDRVINGKIYEYLKGKQKPKPKDGNNDKACKTRPSYGERPKPGWVYIIESDEHAPCHVKIGITTREPDWRRRQWEECNMSLELVTDIDRNAFDHHAIVESLIKYELHRCRRTFKCAACRKVHEEWYETNRTKAMEHIGKWRDWIKSKQPFDRTGILTPYWGWKVRRLPKILDDVDWDVWRNPSWLDYWAYQQESFGNNYYFFLRDHLSRKDLTFCMVGAFILLLLNMRLGKLAVVWGILGLVAL